MKKKILSVLFVLVLVLSFSLMTAVAAAAVDQLEVWVDDDFTEATQGWDVTHFDTIQEGVTAVAAGGTVDVAAGTYNEHVVIGKQLTLLGANHDVNPVTHLGERVDESIIDGTQLTPAAGGLVYITGAADGIVFKGFTVRESFYSAGGIDIAPGSDNSIYENNIVSDNENTAFFILGDGNVIRNNVISDNRHSGEIGQINLQMDVDDCIIENNAISGGGWIQIMLWNAHHGNIVQNNTITGVGLDEYYANPTGQTADAFGILLSDVGIGNIVRGNTIAPEEGGAGFSRAINIAGARFGGLNTLVEANIIHNNGVGVKVGTEMDTTLIKGNDIQENEYGIRVERTAINTIIEQNDLLSNEVGIIIAVGSAPTAASTTHINHNNIVGNTSQGMLNEIPTLVDATLNWWGSGSGPTHDSNTYTVPAGDPQGNAVSDEVNFVRWLDATYDTGVSFAPVENIDSGEQFSSIQAAIDDDLTENGDNITVAAGTYDLTATIVVDESVILTGDVTTPSNVVINGPPTGSCFDVTADDVTIQGFRIQGARDTSGPNVWGVGVNIGIGSPGVQNTTVSYNEITDNSYGIYVYKSQHITISHNKIYSNRAGEPGCWNGKGIIVYSEGAPGPPQPLDVKILKNEIYDNELFGIELNVWDVGEWINVGVLIDGNKIYNNGGPLYDWAGWGNPDFECYRGISANFYFANVTITNNEIYGHKHGDLGKYYNASGIGIRAAGIKNWTISDNNIHDNVRGIYIYNEENYPPGTEGFLASTNVNITANDVHANAQGIVVRAEGELGDIGYAHYNNIHANDVTTYTAKGISPAGVVNLGEVPFDATKNWWGDASGPAGAQVIGDPGTYTGVLPGTGNKVSAKVKCMPWLTRPFKTVIEDDIAYFGVSFPVKKGWNIVSTPLALDAHVTAGVYATNTWGGLYNLGKAAVDDQYALKLHYTGSGIMKVFSPIYYYDSNPDSPNFGWREATALTELNPVDAFYIRMKESDSIPILFSPDLSVPSKKLYKGWNLVGCAYMDVMFAEDGQPLETALATITTVSSPAGDVKGYAQVVSPPLNQKAWIFIPPPPDGGTYIPEGAEGVIKIGRGYWVFMENPGTLAGLTFTPMSLPSGGPPNGPN